MNATRRVGKACRQGVSAWRVTRVASLGGAPHQRQRRGMPTTKINRKLKMMLSLITSNLRALSSSRSARSLSFCEEPW